MVCLATILAVLCSDQTWHADHLTYSPPLLGAHMCTNPQAQWWRIQPVTND